MSTATHQNKIPERRIFVMGVALEKAPKSDLQNVGVLNSELKAERKKMAQYRKRQRRLELAEQRRAARIKEDVERHRQQGYEPCTEAEVYEALDATLAKAVSIVAWSAKHGLARSAVNAAFNRRAPIAKKTVLALGFSFSVDHRQKMQGNQRRADARRYWKKIR